MTEVARALRAWGRILWSLPRVILLFLRRRP